jgi:hypothetical protein
MKKIESMVNVHGEPPTLEAWETQRERLDSKFALNLVGLAVFGAILCNGLFTLVSPYDFGQPRWLSWISLIAGLAGVPFFLLKAVMTGKFVTGFEWAGVDTSMVMQEGGSPQLVRNYCEAVDRQKRMLTTIEALMLKTYFTEAKALDRITASMKHSSVFLCGNFSP